MSSQTGFSAAIYWCGSQRSLPKVATATVSVPWGEAAGAGAAPKVQINTTTTNPMHHSCGSRCLSCSPALSPTGMVGSPLQPQGRGATAEVGTQVRGIVLLIRLPGGCDDLGRQLYIVLLLCRIALNGEDEFLARLRILQPPLLSHHRR